MLLREVLHNAIAHADYSRQGQHLKVSIFSDKMLVDSPGTLPAGMSFEALEGGVSIARNRAIMNILHLIGYVEKHGTIFAKAVAASNEGYPMPEWSEPGPLVRVTLRPHPKASAAPASEGKRRDRTDELVEYLGLHGVSTLSELSAAIGISSRQLRTYIRRLEDAGAVEATSAGEYDPTKGFRLVKPGS